MPEIGDRKALMEKVHELLMHRGPAAVYYEIRKEYYWPGMKNEIENELKECEVCKINNRKKAGGSEFIVTTRKGEKIALDLIDIREEGKYIQVAIDYFTRMVKAEVMPDKCSGSVIGVLREWLNAEECPEEIITDNGKEFVSEEFRKFCIGRKIAHRRVSVESHRSNGRVERVIGTIREGLIKNKEGVLDEKLSKLVSAYNMMYHSAIDCSPLEAIKDLNENALVGNSAVSRYGERFRRMTRDKFAKGQIVRIAAHENLGTDTKRTKGRFIEQGVVEDVLSNDSYLVRYSNGRLAKRRHYDLKIF